MSKENSLAKAFGERLRSALKDAGFISTRSPSGVSLDILVAITGHSSQICRRYVKGEIIPRHAELMNIANALQVLPGWLLFGEEILRPNKHDVIIIDKKIFEALLRLVFKLQLSSEESATFIIEKTAELNELKLEPEQAMRIIDLMIRVAKV